MMIQEHPLQVYTRPSALTPSPPPRHPPHPFVTVGIRVGPLPPNRADEAGNGHQDGGGRYGG